MPKLVDQRKQAKLLWLQDPYSINGDKLNNIRCEARRHFKKKKWEYLKELMIMQQTVRAIT
jgi:hypothetical protein